MVDFQKKGLDKKKVFVVRDEALGFSLPSLLVNSALRATSDGAHLRGLAPGQYSFEETSQ